MSGRRKLARLCSLHMQQRDAAVQTLDASFYVREPSSRLYTSDRCTQTCNCDINLQLQDHEQ
jgi:hypothetical protein